MMKSHYGVKNKKGFSLIECVVALVLFSIVTGSVLTAFAASRKQIKNQNDQYKIDLMANNILSSYEGSNTSESFRKRLKGLGIDLSDPDSFNTTIGTAGTGQYCFDVNNVPVAVPFTKLTVMDGTATFKDENGDMVSFEGNYPDNELQGFDWEKYYDRSDLKYSDGSMTLTGVVNLSGIGNCDYTYTVNYKGNVTLETKPQNSDKYSSKSGEKPVSSFDNYLIRKGYYLKSIYRTYSFSLFGTTYDYFYFQVYNAVDNTPVKNGDGKCLFYCITIATNDEVNNYYLGLYNNMANSDVKMYMDFDNITGKSKNGSIKFGYANEGTSYNKISFNDTLYDDNGKNFTGDWYYYPWLVANTDEPSTMSSRGGVPNISVSCSDNKPVQKYYEYTVKDDVASNITYALNSSNKTEMYLFNTDGEAIFAFNGDTRDPLQNLISNCSFGVNGKRNTQTFYNEKLYDKWYLKGAVPDWLVTKITYKDGGANGTSTIEFYGKATEASPENKYITFTYAKEDYSEFKSDLETVFEFGGVCAAQYDYTKTYTAKNLNTITDATALAPYKNLDKIKEKLASSVPNETWQYYTVTNGTKNQGSWISPKYDHTYTYYTYTVSATKISDLTNYTERSRGLTIANTGDTVTCTETVNASATVSSEYTYSMTSKNGSVNQQTSSRSTPDTPLDQLKNGTYIKDGLVKTHQENVGSWTKPKYETVTDWDYTSISWVYTNVLEKTKPATATETIDGIVIDTTYYAVPENLAAEWNVVSTPTEAALHTVSTLSSFVQNDNSYDVVVGDNLIFTAHPTEFLITAGVVSTGTTDCAYDIIGAEEANIMSETYYITWTCGDRTLVSVVTYSNFTKGFEFDGVTVSKEPKITIWSMPSADAQALGDVKNIVDNAEYNKYLYRSYRKG